MRASDGLSRFAPGWGVMRQNSFDIIAPLHIWSLKFFKINKLTLIWNLIFFILILHLQVVLGNYELPTNIKYSLQNLNYF